MDWYVDAWDGRGGHGFASQRAPNSDIRRAQDRDIATIFVGPPGFQPELVANRAIALSAGRSAVFDHQVVLDGLEVGFPSAQAFAEFVRRGFISGGRGRGPEGEGPAPPEGGPEAPPDVAPGSISRALSAFCSQFQQPEERAEKAAHLLRARLVDNLGKMYEEDGDSSYSDAAASGAAQLIGTLLAAYPGPQTQEALRQWEAAAGDLHRAVSDLDLWNEWQFDGARSGGASIVPRYLAAEVGKFWVKHVASGNRNDLTEAETAILVASILLSGNAYDTRNGRFGRFRWLRYWIHGMSFEYWPMLTDRNIGIRGDRFEAMFSYPLPQYVQRNFSGISSVGQLLVELSTSPGRFAGVNSGVLHIVVFAAAVLASRVIDRSTPDWRSHAATAWLRRSLPRWAFTPKVEQIIQNVGRSSAVEANT